MARVRPIPDGFGVAQVVFSCIGDSRTPEITFGFLDDTARTPDEVATAIRGHWLTAFPASGLSNQWSLTKVMVTVNRLGMLLDGIDGNVSAGTSSDPVVSLAVALLLRKQTGLGGRANRGRIYLVSGYLTEATVDQAGVVLAADVPIFTTRWTDLITALSADGLTMNIIHSAISPAVPPPPSEVVTGFCESMVATQRRRQRKVGRGRRTGP